MNAFRQRLGLMICGVLAAGGAWACVATHNPDGSWDIEITPDMTVTAWGLEDALGKLADLLGACITGNYSRPCTQSEMDEIGDNIDKVLERKGRMRDPESPSSGGGLGV